MRRQRKAINQINVVPYIDVMLVLLIMLIMTIPIQSHAVKLDMPRPNQNPPTTTPTVVELVIDFDGTLIWNGEYLQDRDALKANLATIAVQTPQPELHLRPHKLSKYDHLAVAMAMAQKLGVKHMGVVGNDKLME